MFAMFNIGISVLLVIMMFGVYSKLNELSAAIKRLTKQAAQAEPAATPQN